LIDRAVRDAARPLVSVVIPALNEDGSADPAEIPRFVQAPIDGVDFAKGMRFAKSEVARPPALGSRALTAIFILGCHTHYSDLCHGFNVFWRGWDAPVRASI
jgi:hypothetical protein